MSERDDRGDGEQAVSAIRRLDDICMTGAARLALHIDKVAVTHHR
jgi:hypothetical protein